MEYASVTSIATVVNTTVRWKDNSVHIPKPVLFALALLGAAFVGWMIHTSTGTSAGAAAAVPLASEATASREAALPPIHVTVVMPDPESSPGTGTPGIPRRAGSTAQPTRRLAPTSSRAQHVAAPQPMATAQSTASPVYLGGPGGIPGLSIFANGNDIVVAAQGSIVSVGDNTVVHGNTGDAASSGTITLDVADSTVTSGSSSTSGDFKSSPAVGGFAATGGTTYPLDALNGGLPLTNAQNNGLQPPPTPQAVIGGASGGGFGSRAIGIAGYETHSVDITGNDNLATYDDSDLFFHRNGILNGNTGDTDTSGLNVVDSIGSRVRSGNSGNSDETPDPPPFDPSDLGSPARAAALTNNPTGGASVSIADINGISTATGQDSLVIGGDGMDDNGVRIRGDRNVATYDDGNVAIGGTGNVNAQIGDSDTSGAVVMGTRYSDIAAGDSFLPAWQQAGAQVGDPFDGNDPDLGLPAHPTPRLPASPAPLADVTP
jgi:hypothetical protein